MVTRTDIANIACRACGVKQIAAGALLTENSGQAYEIRQCYDELRQAELRRNVWRFATRKCVLRAIDTDTMAVTFPTYASGTTYSAFAVVVDSSGQLWESNAGSNLGHTPSDDTTYWGRYFGPTVAALYDSDTTYASGEVVYVSTTAYRSLISGNSDTPPSSNWRTLTSATLATLEIGYPIGAGPVSQSETRNVFVLPNGFLRQAPDDPPQGSYHPLGAPVGLSYNDWLWEGNYIISRTAGPILLRFVADIADPNQFDQMFRQGFGLRIAMSVNPRLTQSSAKLADIVSEYQKFMSEARLVNGIETGPTNPPDDDYIQCRL